MNTSIFETRGKSVPTADATNDAGGKAYARSAEEALAQYAVTGTFGGTYYVGGFSDTVFDVVARFVEGEDGGFVGAIDGVEL